MLQATTAATATGTSSVQKSGSPPTTAPTEIRTADRATWTHEQLPGEEKRRADCEKRRPEHDVACVLELDECEPADGREGVEEAEREDEEPRRGSESGAAHGAVAYVAIRRADRAAA